jgi:membrane protein required for beta-lactamase induction
MNHIIPALLVQLLLSPFGWWLGALFAIGYYLGREMAQAEYRVIQTYYGGKRANMPWWGAFQRRAWNVKSILDWVLPSLAVVIVAIVAPRLI